MVVSTVDTSSASENPKIINIQVAHVIVTTRLRTTDEDKVRDLSESIASIGLLHPIAVAERDEKYVLLSGLHNLAREKIIT